MTSPPPLIVVVAAVPVHRVLVREHILEWIFQMLMILLGLRTNREGLNYTTRLIGRPVSTFEAMEIEPRRVLQKSDSRLASDVVRRSLTIG